MNHATHTIKRVHKLLGRTLDHDGARFASVVNREALRHAIARVAIDSVIPADSIEKLYNMRYSR